MATILIVDDEDAIRDIFTVYLGNSGFRAVPAKGGHECMDLLKSCMPDLILLDLMMEPMDGWATLRAIRDTPETGHVPVIIITGKQPTHSDIVRYGGLIEGFIMKPVDFRTIVSSLHHCIEKNQAMAREFAEKNHQGHDPALLAEYGRLLRTVWNTRSLTRRMKDSRWADPVVTRRCEDDLNRLHTRLGFPDSMLVREGDRCGKPAGPKP
jgi:two-component system, OmpR family, response regulator